MANPRTIARLEAQIQRRAAHCLQFEVADPRSAFLTITRVELSKDLANAKIYYSVLGDESERTKTAHMLEQAGGFIQRQVASILHTRVTPRLRWVYDESISEAARLDQLIREARERDRAISGESEEDDPQQASDDSPAKDLGEDLGDVEQADARESSPETTRDGLASERRDAES